MSPHTKQFIIQSGTKKTITAESELDHPLHISSTKKFEPQKTTIVFDLHGVIFQTSIRNVLKSIWHCPHKSTLFKLLFNLRFVCDLLLDISRKKVIEQCIHRLANKYHHFDQIKPTAFALAHAQKPINHTVHLLKQLKKRGYRLVAFSNIGTQSMKVLKKQYPAILNLFDITIYSSKDDDYIAKPSPEAFKKLFRIIGNNKNCIFIDDTINNIQQAYQYNIYSILFIDAFILEQSLNQIGIL